MSTLQHHSTEKEHDFLLKENEALQQQHMMLRNLLEKTQSENLRFKQRIEQLAAALQERDKQLIDMQQFEYHFKRSKENAKELENNNEKAQQAIAALEDEKKLFESTLTEHLQRIKQLEHVIQFLRSKAETAHLEAKQLQADLQKTHSDAATITQQCHEKNEQIETLHKELEKEKLAHIDTANELLSIQQQWKHMQNVVSTAHNHVEEVKGTEKQKYHALEEEHYNAKRLIEEKEHEIRIAQQHLGKKIKELAILNEKHEEAQKYTLEQQKALNESRFKLNAFQINLDTHIEQEKKLQEQILEMTKAAEIQTKKWEEKYFQMLEQIKQLELHNKELKNVEEKYAQMQSLLNNLGSIVSTPLPKQADIPFHHPEKISEKTIFDSSKNGPRYKQNLFE